MDLLICLGQILGHTANPTHHVTLPTQKIVKTFCQFANFIRTAKAKGLPMRRVIWKHAMKPAMLPVLSYLGPAFVGMITGSVVIDSFFSTGGIGTFFVNSAFTRDYSVMMGITILVGALTIIFNLLVDVLYAWIDPKIRY